MGDAQPQYPEVGRLQGRGWGLRDRPQILQQVVSSYVCPLKAGLPVEGTQTFNLNQIYIRRVNRDSATWTPNILSELVRTSRPPTRIQRESPG